MANHLFVTKPTFESLLTWLTDCQLDPLEIGTCFSEISIIMKTIQESAFENVVCKMSAILFRCEFRWHKKKIPRYLGHVT